MTKPTPHMSAVGAIWLQFVLCASLIGAAGYQLSRYGDVIAQRTGMSGGWIGLALLATDTSLPKLATGISSVTVAMYLLNTYVLFLYGE